MAGTDGNYAVVMDNGVVFTEQANEINFPFTFRTNPIMPQNIGAKQNAIGMQAPGLTLSGYVRRGNGSFTAHNLYSPSGVGSAADTEHIITILLGENASPTTSNRALMYDGTLMDYKRSGNPQGIQTWNATFRPRGKREQFSGLILYNATTAASTITSTGVQAPLSQNAVALGGVAHLQVFTPSGTAATGTVTVSGIPSDADTVTVTVGGVAYLYTFKTSPASAGHVKIGASATASALNLYYAMVGSPEGLKTSVVYAGTTAIPQDQPTALVSVSVPSASNVITLTAYATGTAANAYALAKSGTNLAVSGATFAGGVAGETHTITVQTAATQGGSYTTRGTFTSNGTTRTGERLELAAVSASTEVWIRINDSVSGSSQQCGYCVTYAPYYPGQ